MNKSAHSTTATTSKAGGSSLSFKRLGQLLQLDFAFHHRQWIQILTAGLLAAFVPVIVSALLGMLFGMGGNATDARGIYTACLYCGFLAVSTATLISYNKRVNGHYSPLSLQIPASATEKYISLILLTLALHIITPLLGAVAWTLYMLFWALIDGVQVLAQYPEVLIDPLGYSKPSLDFAWTVSLMISMQLASYATYIYCLISARKPIRAILRFMGIGFGLFVLSVLGVSMLMHLLDICTISPDMSGHYMVLEFEQGELSISLLAMTIPIYLYAFAMIWLGLGSLRRKQVKA